MNFKSTHECPTKPLCPEGSTYAAEGIRMGYDMAKQASQEGYTNHVNLGSDDVAEVGRTRWDKTLEAIQDRVNKGIALAIIGFQGGGRQRAYTERNLNVQQFLLHPNGDLRYNSMLTLLMRRQRTEAMSFL